MARQPKGRPTIYQGADGLYHCYLTVGTYADGRTKRKHFKRSSAELVLQAIDEYQERQKRGLGEAGKIETVAQWMAYYTEQVVRPSREYATWRDVESVNRLYITAHLGQWRLSGPRRRLEPEHVEAMYAAMSAAGLSPTYVRRTHRILSRALKVALRRGRADRNVCDMLDAPTARQSRPKPLSQEHAVAVLREALAEPMAARYVLGIVAGPRQGEVLGLRWSRVELDPAAGVPHIWITRKLQRRSWQHGCADPVACVREREHSPCRTKPCPPRYEHGCGYTCGKAFGHLCPSRRVAPGCSRHVTKAGEPKACPPLCPTNCSGHASTCPQRIGGGLVEGQTKSERGDRPLAVGELVAELLRQHRERQQQWCASRGMPWDAEGYVFADANGMAIDPRRDYEAWASLLERAGVPHQKLHSARHTAGTFLRAVGADLRLIQEQLGHAQLATTGGYVGVALQAQEDAVNKVAAALIDGELSALLGAKRVASQSVAVRGSLSPDVL